MRQRLARAHAAGAEPAVRHRRRGHRADGPGGDGGGPLDALGGPAQHLRHRPRRLARATRGTTSACSTGCRRCATAGSPRRSSSTSTRKVGRWKEPQEMVQEGRPFLPAGGFDPWSARNMRLSPDGGATPAPRRSGDVGAMRNAYTKRAVLRRRHRHADDRLAAVPRGEARHAQLPPVVRHPAADARPRRRRLQPGDLVPGAGHGGDLRCGRQAFAGDRRVAGEPAQHPWRASRATSRSGPWTLLHTLRRRRSPAARTCGTAILDHRPAGACTRASRSTRPRASWRAGRCGAGSTSARCRAWSRRSRRALRRWRPSAAERARLEQIFPTGVCDYTRPDVGRL